MGLNTYRNLGEAAQGFNQKRLGQTTQNSTSGPMAERIQRNCQRTVVTLFGTSHVRSARMLGDRLMPMRRERFDLAEGLVLGLPEYALVDGPGTQVAKLVLRPGAQLRRHAWCSDGLPSGLVNYRVVVLYRVSRCHFGAAALRVDAGENHALLNVERFLEGVVHARVFVAFHTKCDPYWPHLAPAV